MTTPEFEIYGKPNCRYCDEAKRLLDDHKKTYEFKDVSVDQSILNEMLVKVPGARTVPQIFRNGTTYIGGFDQLRPIIISEMTDDLWD